MDGYGLEIIDSEAQMAYQTVIALPLGDATYRRFLLAVCFYEGDKRYQLEYDERWTSIFVERKEGTGISTGQRHLDANSNTDLFWPQ